MVRATTGGVLRNYRYNLMNSFITDNKARDTVLSQRVFNSYAEDPAAAAKSFRLRKSRLMTSSQLKICDDTVHKFNAAYASLQTIDELIDTTNGKGNAVSTLKDTTLRMLNDPTGDARAQLNTVLDQLDDSILQNMNQKYGDNFIFAGADGRNVPFTVEEIDGHKTLFYRGIPVDAAVPKLQQVDDPANPGEKMNIELTETDPNSGDTKTSYVLASAEKIPIVPFKAGTVLTGESGTQYYIRDDHDPATVLTQDQYDALKKEKDPADGVDKMVLYTAILNDPTDSTKGVSYYLTSDLTSAESADDTYANGILKDAATGNPYVYTDEQGNRFYISNDPSGIISQEDYDQACSDAAKLEYLANEKRFVDIGLGFQEDESGRLIESSAFNDSLSGLAFLGYGKDDDGDPKNIYSIVQELKDIAKSVPADEDWDEDTYNRFYDLVGKLEDASSDFKTQFTNHSAGTQKLTTNSKLLESNAYDLKEQYSNLEDVNMADAISSFLWAEYCYNAALKVGNSVLGQTLMDYLS